MSCKVNRFIPTPPKDVKAGDKLLAPFGIVTVETVEFSPTGKSYVIQAKGAKGEFYRTSAAIGHWPEVLV